MLVTHRGLSGPSLLQISSYWQPGDALRLDLLPTLDAEAFLREQRQSRPTAELKTVLSDQLPKRFAQRLCEAWLPNRSEEHTSELQSLMRISYAVFCLKTKKKLNIRIAQLHGNVRVTEIE